MWRYKIILHCFQFFPKMPGCYSWENRIKFLVRYLYDLDNNGFLNKHDFDCLAVKFTVLEGRGVWNDKRYLLSLERKSRIIKFNFEYFSFIQYSMIMSELWDQISDIADLNKVRINFNLTLVHQWTHITYIST